MAKYFGKNTIRSSVRLFYERGNFHLNAYEDLEISDHVRDTTFGEFQMYGRINTNMLPVVPNEEFLVEVSNPSQPELSIRGLDFVVEAFEKVRAAFRNACHTNAIPRDDPFLSSINAVRGYESPFEIYDKYMEEILNVFRDEYIVVQGRRPKIITINDYVNHLVKYLQILTYNLPLTFSSWQKSKESSIFTSGIAFSIADLKADNDEIKENLFLNNPIFQYYLNVCKQNGFNIVKNAPWIMFADLDSAAMKNNHLVKRFIPTPRLVFANRYTSAYSFDIELLEEVIVRNYNKFVIFYPIEKKYYICNNYNINNRNNINNITETLSSAQLMRLYSHMKNIEEGGVFKKADLNKIIKNAKNHAKFVDNQKGISYINERFRQTFKSKPGGINSIIKATKKYNS